MQVNDFKNIQEAIKYEVLQDEKEYLKLSKVIGNNQKYDFSSQLSIYNKEPEARACEDNGTSFVFINMKFKDQLK
ncbi:hypothetical protein [Facklamia hominis]